MDGGSENGNGTDERPETHRAEDFGSCNKRDCFPGVQETWRERRNARP